MKPTITLPRCHMRFVIAALSMVTLAACSDSTTGPASSNATSIQVSATAVTATAIGQSVAIQASVIDQSGAAVPNAAIRWELSAADVLESLGDGKFRVLKEGSVRVTAVWSKDSTVRTSVTVNINAGLMASACVSRSDQAAPGTTPKCAQQRVVVRTAAVSANDVASSPNH